MATLAKHFEQRARSLGNLARVTPQPTRKREIGYTAEGLQRLAIAVRGR